MVTYFAHINKERMVDKVIVATREFIDSGVVGSPKEWVETSKDGSVRKNYAGIGYKYEENIDAFVPPKPFASWVLDEQRAKYVAPIKQPTDEPYLWKEDTQEWILDVETITKIDSLKNK